MRPREFWRQCKQHNWNWEESADEKVQAKGAANEHKLRSIAAESYPCMEIWVRFKNSHSLMKEVQSG